MLFRSWEGQTEIEIRFIAEAGGTRVELEHRGWEQGPIMQEVAKRYDGGWETIFARYQSQVVATG